MGLEFGKPNGRVMLVSSYTFVNSTGVMELEDLI